MGRVIPLTTAERAKIRKLHGEGKGRNDIAKALKRSGDTISKAAADMGLSFSRGPEVAAATEAKVADARLRRAELVLGMIEDAHKLRGQLFAPTVAFNIGGKDNVYTEQAIPEPTFGDKRAITQAMGNLVNTMIRIEEHDSGSGLPQAVSLLERIFTGLTSKWGNGDDEFPAASDA